MDQDHHKNTKPLKCRACGSTTAVKKLTTDYELYHAGLYHLFEMPLGIDHLMTENTHYCTRCGYKF